MKLAVDIGYSNLKGLYGEQFAVATPFVSPAGAGPVSQAPRDMGGKMVDGTVVSLADQPNASSIDAGFWVAGCDPSVFGGTKVRKIDERYPMSLDYLALYRAALSKTGADRVEQVTTGLPVAQFLDAQMRRAVSERLKGTHRVERERTVVVEQVKVVPQAIGAYLDYSGSGNHRGLLANGRVLVIDVGFYSVDFALIDRGTWQSGTAGSSYHACSRVFEVSAQLLRRQYGHVSVERIERAVRDGAESVLISGEPVALSSFWSRAVSEVARSALSEIQRQMRLDQDSVDLVLLTGGGGASYRAAAREVFEHSKVDMSPHPVEANSRGYWGMMWA